MFRFYGCLFLFCMGVFGGGIWGGEESGGAAHTRAASCEGEQVRVSGQIRQVGNMPFPELVITDDEGNDWFVAGGGKELLERHSQPRVTVRGTARFIETRLANGAVIGTRRQLEDIKILK